MAVAMELRNFNVRQVLALGLEDVENIAYSEEKPGLFVRIVLVLFLA